MDINLHLGAHRCASSTFQGYLWRNRVALARGGLTCWTPKRTRDGLMAGMIRHPESITLQDEHRAARSVGRIRLEISRLGRAGQDRLLISEENLIGSSRRNVRMTSLYPLVSERLLRFVPAFEGHRLRIGIGVRSYEDYWASALAYILQTGGARPTVDQLDFLTTQPRRWRDVIRDIGAVFPQADVFVFPFERFADQPDAILDTFCDGAADPLPAGFTHHNKSPNLGELNTLLDLRGERRLDGGARSDHRRWMPFDEDQRAVLRAEYRRDLAWLKAGAEGLARYVEGRKTPATLPDRAQEETRVGTPTLTLMKGQTDGIEKRLERPRTG
ncbi:hypothetical protein [Pseudooctadecabacter sp.]|uniref:hypothetical protein n=1 Tax=Pseudooctadecabacter sp. TaxID=1966338 RepID=UPI0025EFBBB1|nr:hypothetical protein [Pseudooctadecabacter sp.]